jgi:uncharacterized delta-60 repeat protein
MKRFFTGFSVCFFFALFFFLYKNVNAQLTSISPKPVYFGQIPQSKSTDRALIVRNISTETLNISQIVIQGTDAADFTVVDNPGSTSISAFGRLELMIRFTPQSTGEKTAQISLTSNAPGSPDVIDLNAGGTRLSGVVTFERILGTLESDGASDIRVTSDGGYIIAGSTNNPDEERSDAYLVKLNSFGETEWSGIYDSDDGDDNSDGFSSVMPVSDGYICVGNSENGVKDQDIWIVKTDLDGKVLRDSLIGGGDDDVANVIEATNDGNYIVAGYYTDPTAVNKKDGYLLKLDEQGKVLWSSTIGGTNAERFNSIKQTSDNGYIVCGDISFGSDSDVYLVKTNAMGELTWDKQYGESGESSVDIAASIVVAPDGGFVMAGRTTSSFSAGANDVYIIKTDASGVQDQSWGNKTFGQEHHDGAGEIITTSDGGYLIVGSIENRYEPLPVDEWYSDVYIIKLDQNGNLEWDMVYGGDKEESASSVRELSDGSFVISGYTLSYGSSSSDRDIYFLRVNADGNLITAIEKNINIIPAKMHLSQNYPNPFNGTTKIAYTLSENSNMRLNLFDLNGRLVQTLVEGFRRSGSYEISLDANSLASGVYLYQLITENFNETKKLLLIK